MFWKSFQIFKSGVGFRAQSEMDRGSFYWNLKMEDDGSRGDSSLYLNWRSIFLCFFTSF